ncbi:MAG: N-methyl-L-tryptophan oxidase [Chitinophagaceae bacterium]|nr:N-methyl-L-tryptophan oxidase [Chitinophagaceae bacterium]
MEELKKKVSNTVDQSGSPVDKHFDVIVLGVGSMGSAACYFLARSGAKVLGLEQFDIPHEMGSHAGQSRIIRKAYFEHPDYVPLLESAYANWKELERITQAEVYIKTGLLYFGKPDHQVIKGVLESAGKYRIPVEKLDNRAATARYPQVSLPNGYTTLLEPDAGFVTPERAILLYTDQAIQLGAVIKTKTAVFHWKKEGDDYTVSTNQGEFRCKKLVITSGPWTAKLVPALKQTLTVTRQVIAWVIPRKPASFEWGRWPCWMIADEHKPGIYYGFPILPVGRFHGPIGFKLAHHTPGMVSDTDTVSRIPTPEDEANLAYCLDKYFPDGYANTHVMKTCLYTNTPDEHFIIDYLPGHEGKVAIAAGFSGHGFKFVSVVGEILRDLVLSGSTSHPIGFLHAKRFPA